MKYTNLIICCAAIFYSCTAKRYPQKSGRIRKETVQFYLSDENLMKVKPGIPVYDTALLSYQKPGVGSLHINSSQPVIVTEANEPQAWGNYQFPSLDYGVDGGLVARTHLSPDAVASYGKTRYIYSFSKDEGRSWSSVTEQIGSNEDNKIADGILLANGDRVKITTPPSINEKDLKLPAPVIVKNDKKFYRLNQLPEERQGVFMARMKKGTNTWLPEKAALIDDKALRYSLKNEMPVVWWGDFKIAVDGSLIAGIYPGYYVDDNGAAHIKSGIFFYRSTDNGHTWKIQGRIPYEYDKQVQPKGNEFGGFTEPTFEVLADGSFLCVMRTTDNDYGPMYASRSVDLGKSWSKPKAIAPAGVLPRLLRLKNGVLILASGRPGVQLRFCTDGIGEVWSQPFEMVNYDLIPNVDWFSSCGYTNLLSAADDKFYIIYSDFFTMNGKGQMRKSIKVRSVTVDQAK